MSLQWRVKVTNYISVSGWWKESCKPVFGICSRIYEEHFQVSADAVSHSALIGAINGTDPQCES